MCKVQLPSFSCYVATLASLVQVKTPVKTRGELCTGQPSEMQTFTPASSCQQVSVAPYFAHPLLTIVLSLIQRLHSYTNNFLLAVRSFPSVSSQVTILKENKQITITTMTKQASYQLIYHSSYCPISLCIQSKSSQNIVYSATFMHLLLRYMGKTHSQPTPNCS